MDQNSAHCVYRNLELNQTTKGRQSNTLIASRYIYKILFQASIYIWRKIHRRNTILVFEFVIFDTGFVFIKQALSKFMAGNRHNTEVPYQNYDKLKQTILMKRQRGKPELFIDPSFPPDLSSLTYVYIGDDRYERTKFARPLVGIICQMHVLCTCLMNFFIHLSPDNTGILLNLSQSSQSGYKSMQLDIKRL